MLARPARRHAPWFLQRALLTPRVNPRSHYRCAKSTKEQAASHDWRRTRLKSAQSNGRGTRFAGEVHQQCVVCCVWWGVGAFVCRPPVPVHFQPRFGLCNDFLECLFSSFGRLLRNPQYNATWKRGRPSAHRSRPLYVVRAPPEGATWGRRGRSSRQAHRVCCVLVLGSGGGNRGGRASFGLFRLEEGGLGLG